MQDLKKYSSWWLCENILCHDEQIGLLRMDFPRVFILVRNYSDIYPCNYEDFANSIAELNFIEPKDRENANIEDILTDAWNFLALSEEKEERLYNEYNDED